MVLIARKHAVAWEPNSSDKKAYHAIFDMIADFRSPKFDDILQ